MTTLLAIPSLTNLLLLSFFSIGVFSAGEQEPLQHPIDPNKYRAACPDYKTYAMRPQYVIAFMELTACADVNE